MNQTEVGREYQGTFSGYCRSCRETEIFDRYLVNTRHEITGEIESWLACVCQGCGHEAEGIMNGKT